MFHLHARRLDADDSEGTITFRVGNHPHEGRPKMNAKQWCASFLAGVLLISSALPGYAGNCKKCSMAPIYGDVNGAG